MELYGKKVLVIGGSGKLGSLICDALASKGALVFASARSEESATRIPNSVNLKLLLDLESEESLSIFSNYVKNEIDLDGIFIASGAVGFSDAQNTTAEQATRLMQINHLAPTKVVTELLSNMLSKETSFVAAITGVVAEKSFPKMSAYCASKSALSAWLEALAAETRQKTLKVFEFQPGHTETGLASRAIFGQAPAFPKGLEAESVTSKMIDALITDKTLLTSNDFSNK